MTNGTRPCAIRSDLKRSPNSRCFTSSWWGTLRPSVVEGLHGDAAVIASP
jgi:hypothetical protein